MIAKSARTQRDLRKMDRVGCILVENEPLALGMMLDYIISRSDLDLLGIARGKGELRDLLKATRPEIIFLDLIIPAGKAADFDFNMLPKDATVVTVSGVPLRVYDERHLLRNPIELYKPVSYEKFVACVDRIMEERRNSAW